MDIKDNLNAVYSMWLMHCPGPRVFRWITNHFKNLDN